MLWADADQEGTTPDADDPGGAVAVAEPVAETGEPIVVTQSPPKRQTKTKNKVSQPPPYNVVILNDEEHTFPYVIDLLTKVFKHSLAVAEQLTNQIDKQGRAIVLTTHKELAELKCEQVLSYGPDPLARVSRGPLQCYIEPAV